MPEPWNARELRAVRDLVQGDPHAELLGWEGVLLLEGEDVRPHVVDEVLVLGILVLQHQQVVLAEHPGRHPAEQCTHLGAGDLARHHRHRTRHPLLERSEHGSQESTVRGDVGGHPVRTVDDLGARRSGQGSEADLEFHMLLCLCGEAFEVGLETRRVVRLGERVGARDARGDGAGERPVDRLAHRGPFSGRAGPVCPAA